MRRIPILLAAVTALVSSLSLAQSENARAEVRRKGVVEFRFDPKPGRMDLAVFAPNGTDTLRVDALQVNAIGDQWERGRTIPGEVQRAGAGAFTVALGLPEGTWNIHLKATLDGQPLEGLYLLGVGKFPTNGRFALTAPSLEVNRLVWITSLMLGVPLGLGLLVTVFALVSRARQTAQIEA